MQVHFGNRRKIQFTDKTHPVMGIVSVVMGGASLLLLAILCILSSMAKGASGLSAGYLGILALLVAIVGFVLAARCYQKEDIYLVTPAVGSVLNGMLVVISLLLYVIGAA
ncbi:MAG: hypothetical protein J1F02_06610 [Lachnospiraceae bacterium]|nr:hypothetical protein [Lachnospiraceae bacterium]